MKKIITILILIISLSSYGQEKFTAYYSASVLNFEQTNNTIDAMYKLSKYVSLSSWSSYASGRTQEMGGNYFTSSNLINFSGKKSKIVFSTGHNYILVPSNNFKRHSFVVKLRLKLF